MDENKDDYSKKSLNTMATTVLYKDNNIINMNNGKEKQLINEDDDALNTEIVAKGSKFINEEEIIQDEIIQPKDLMHKLTTTIDPSLSDALDAATSNEGLKLSEIQNAENFNDHIYLETTKKTSHDNQLPSFESDEHLDNDIFYLGVHLQDTTTFDNKDGASAHFSDEQQNLQYDITPTITPETTVTPYSESSHSEMQKLEQCKFNLKTTSLVDDNECLLAKTSEHSPSAIDVPRILNIPTKAALKEAATNLFLQTLNNISTANEIGILEKTQQNSTDSDNQTSAWHFNMHNNTKTQETQNNTTNVEQECANVNTILTLDKTTEISVPKDGNIKKNGSSTLVNVENRLHDNIQCNLVVELQKMKELDNMAEKKMQENSRKMEGNTYKSQKRCKDTILHKLKDNKQMKNRSKRLEEKNLAKKWKNLQQTGSTSVNSRETILNRMFEIDMEIHKLTMEKLNLHEMLRKGTFSSAGNLVSNSSAIETTREDDTTSVQSELLPTLQSSQLAQNAETNCTEINKRNSPSKLVKRRKRNISHNSGNEEIMHHTHKMKTPLIRWKKIPRLEEIVRRENQEEKAQKKKESLSTIIKRTNDSIEDASEDDQIFESDTRMSDHDVNNVQTQQANDKTDDKKADSDVFSGQETSLNKNSDNQLELQDSIEKKTENAENVSIHESDVDKNNDLALNETTRPHSQSSLQGQTTPELPAIYSDDSTWDTLVLSTVSERHEKKKKSTGLALLEENFKKDLAMTRKIKEIARKQKEKQNNFLKSVNNLTMEEEELPLSTLYIRKLQQKRDLLDSLSQKKEDADNVVVDPKIMNNMEEVINAVAENRTKDLYESQSEVRISNDIPTTSNISSLSQPEKYQFYVDAEANANSDWPCQEKEKITLSRQSSNDISDGSNCVFTIVNQSEVPLCANDERNVEPDSSVTPEETLAQESRSSDSVHIHSKENTSQKIDIKVSVPTILIEKDINLELLHKFKNTGNNAVSAELVDSTTNTLIINAEKLGENKEYYNKNPRNLQTVESIVHKDKSEGESEATLLFEKDKDAANIDSNKQNTVTGELQKQQATDSTKNVHFAPQSDLEKSENCADATQHENLGPSIIFNKCDTIATTDIVRNLDSSDSVIVNIDMGQKKTDTESEWILNDTVASKQDNKNIESTFAKGEESNHSEDRSHAVENILGLDRCIDNSMTIDPANEKSDESNEMFNEESCNSDYMTSSTSTLSFNNAINAETSKKTINRKKFSKLTAVRRSCRNTNENVKPNKISEIDGNSNSSEQGQNIHEKDLTTRCTSKSPTMSNEKIVDISLNAKKTRTTQKIQHPNTRKVLTGVESETKVENSVKAHLSTITESTALKNKTTVMKKRKQHTQWEMMNCKVRLIDCGHTFLKPNVSAQDLHTVGVIAINPYASSNTSYDHRNAVIPTVVLTKSFLTSEKLNNKNETEIEILETKSIAKSNDNDLVQESVSVIEINEQEPTRTQYTVHKGPILDIKVQ